MPKAYSYIRMSTPDQLKGDSLRRQLAKTKAYADENGLELVNEFNDIGVSAYRGANSELGALGRFKEQVKSGLIEKGSYLIVESMDRLSRQKVVTALFVLTEIINSGIILVTLDDRQIYSHETLENHTYQLLIALGAMTRAHDESKRKSGLLNDAWIGKREKTRKSGDVMTSQVPGWLKLDKAIGKIVVIPERAKIIEEIFVLTRDGYGAYSLARRLNEHGVKPWSLRKNAVWRESYIKKIICGRSVLGEFQPHRIEITNQLKRKRVPDGDVIQGYFPAVISEQLFREAAAATAHRKNGGSGRKGKACSNLFSGLLRCYCTAGIRYMDKGSPPKGGKYLRCSVSVSGGSCNAPSVKYEIVEHKILHVMDSLDTERVLGAPARENRLAEARYQKALLELEAENVDKKIEMVMEVLQTVGTSLSPKRLGQELIKLELQKKGLDDQLGGLLREIEELITVNPAARKAAMDSLLAELKDQNTDPDRNERTRRALVAELQRTISQITIIPSRLLAWEEMESNPEWKTFYHVQTQKQLESLLRDHGLTMNIQYVGGYDQVVEGLSEETTRIRWSKRHKDLKLIGSLP